MICEEERRRKKKHGVAFILSNRSINIIIIIMYFFIVSLALSFGEKIAKIISFILLKIVCYSKWHVPISFEKCLDEHEMVRMDKC